MTDRKMGRGISKKAFTTLPRKVVKIFLSLPRFRWAMAFFKCRLFCQQLLALAPTFSFARLASFKINH